MVRAVVAPRRATAVVGFVVSIWLLSILPVTAAEEVEDPGSAVSTTESGAAASEAAPWIATELGDVRAVAGSDHGFVAVGSDGFPPEAAAWTSTDGMTWDIAIVPDAAAGTTLTAVVPAADGFAAIGHEAIADGGATDRIVAWHSTDGTTWVPAAVERPRKGTLQAVISSVASGPSGELALGSFIGQDIGRQRLWHSLDGMSWTPTALPDTKGALWSSVAALPDGFLLAGQTTRGRATNWRSSDGTTWTRAKASPRLFDVAASPDGGVVGIGHKAIWTTPDLLTWEKVWTRPRSWEDERSNAFDWVDWVGDRFLVAGRDFGTCAPATDECHRNPLLESPDGRTWVELAGPDGQPGADDATWLEGSAASGTATVIEGQSAGTDVVWLVGGEPSSEGSPA